MPRFTASIGRSWVLPLVLALGCRRVPTLEPAEPGLGLDSQPESAGVEPAPAVGSAVEPACTVVVGSDAEQPLIVDGQPIPIDLEMTEGLRIRNFPYTQDSILLALGSEHPWHTFRNDYPTDTLWELPCDRPSEVRELAKIEGANFAWAELEPDGSGLYFSLGAVHRLDFAKRDHGPVTAPPRLQQCWMAEEPVEAIEFVAGWVGEDRLLVYWGGPCGFEAEWEGGTVVIEDPGKMARRRPSAHVGSITAEASGRVWVGDGGFCAEPQRLWDRGSPGVWRSDDIGESWTFVPIPALAEAGRGIDAIWTNADAHGRVFVHAECCYPGPADECDGGELLHTDDGGRSWQLGPGKAQSVPPGPSSITLDGWILEATLDGVQKRRAGEPTGTSKTVLMPITQAAAPG
jgi:hypothetical protein